MDIVGTFLIKDVLYPGLGLRAAYRYSRVWYWNNKNPPARDGGGLTQAGRLTQEARDKKLRKWGSPWVGAYAVNRQPPDLLGRLRDGETFDIMKGGHTYNDLSIYNRFQNERILEATNHEIQRIRAAGQNGPYARLYARLTNPNTQLEAETDIYKMCSRNAHRAEQFQHFMQKISYQYKIAKKMDKKQRLKYWIEAVLPDMYKKGYDTENKVLEIFMKLMREMSGLS